MFLVLLAGLAAPAAAQNRQAFSTSMVECSIINRELAELGRRGGRDAVLIDRLDRLADLYLVAADERATAEGIKDSRAHIAELHVSLERKWDGRFRSLLAFNENRDWIDYCRSFARAQGLDVDQN